MDPKLKIVIYLATQWIHGVGGGHCGARSVGRGNRSEQSPPPLSCSGGIVAGDLYRLFFIGSG
jgi:hypothetical protein